MRSAWGHWLECRRGGSVGSDFVERCVGEILIAACRVAIAIVLPVLPLLRDGSTHFIVGLMRAQVGLARA